LIVKCFRYHIIVTHFEIFNYDYDNSVNTPIVNFSSNITHRQRQLIYHAYNYSTDNIQAIALFTAISY